MSRGNRRGDQQDASNVANPVWEIPGKLMLVVSSIDKGNADMQELMRSLIEEVKSLRESHKTLAQQHKDLVETLAASTESKLETCTEKITEGMKRIEERPKKEKDLEHEVTKAKNTIATLWQNTLNMQKQAFWNYYHAQRMKESYQELLQSNPPKMPRKFLPRFIEGEPEIEMEIRKQLAVEKFKNEIALQQCRAQRYEQRFQSLDSEMVAHIMSKFKEEICLGLTRRWETDCKEQEEISTEIYNKRKEDWIEESATTGFRNDPSSAKGQRNPNFQNKPRGNSRPRGRGPSFEENDEGYPSGEDNQNRGRQNNGRCPRSVSQSQSRGRRNNNNSGWRNNNNGRNNNNNRNGWRNNNNYGRNNNYNNNSNDWRNNNGNSWGDRPGNQQNFGNNRGQVVVRLPAGNEAVETNQRERVVIPETQMSEGTQGQNTERSEQQNFLFHAQGSTNTNPGSSEQQE